MYIGRPTVLSEFGCYAGCPYIRSLTVLSGFGCYAEYPYMRSLTVLSGFSYYTGCPCIENPTVHYELAAMQVVRSLGVRLWYPGLVYDCSA